MNGIITIDGPAGSGKSTVSRMVADKLGLLLLDTGAMYRAVALKAKRMGLDFDDRENLKKMCRELDLRFNRDGEKTKLYLDGEDISSSIRTPEMDMLSSRVSAQKEVRSAMTDLQRRFAGKGGLVAEGRDMGTVVFPDSNHKFFITASPEVRVERRYKERAGRGESITRQEVERELRKRDHQDETRAIAPLRPAEDAIIIDTSTLNLEQVVERILKKVKKNDE